MTRITFSQGKNMERKKNPCDYEKPSTVVSEHAGTAAGLKSTKHPKPTLQTKARVFSL